MDEWQEVALDDVATLNGGFAFKSSQYTESGRFVLRTVNITDDFAITKEGATFISEREAADYERFSLQEHDTLFVMVAATLGKVGYVRAKDLPALLNQNMWVIRARGKKIEPVFLHYAFREISKIPLSWVGGSARSFLRRDDVRTLRFRLPPATEQQAIADVLAALDDKIELNRRMNETLEGMGQAIFRDWFVEFGPVRRKAAGATDPVAIMGGLTPDPARAAHLAALFPAAFGNDGLPVGWSERPLDSIAEFLNGLALQKHPAKPGEPDLPVIKIAELRNGLSDRSNRAARTLPAKYIIKDGDFIFSWSGSLMAKVWTEGEGALNQHLFKVSSDHYPQWFYGLWVHHHMPEFQLIAASKATTMGHIQRMHLSNATTVCPPDPTIEAMSAVMQPLWDRMIHNELENRTLAETRDYLLPRLMSGAVRVTPQAEAA